MRVISLFSGAGGMDLGFLLAGHDIVWTNDFDKYAVETYRHNIEKYLPNTHSTLGDIMQILGNSADSINEVIPDGDIVIGGFPCQGFSIANVDRNMDDEKNYLYLELLRVIEAKNVPFFLLENVKGLENMEEGQILEMILDDLERAGTENGGPGYTVIYNVLNALDFGVPQNRERVIIYGVRNDLLDVIDIPELSNERNIRKRLYVRNTHSIDSDIVDPVLPRDKVNALYQRWINNLPTRDLFNEDLPIYSYTALNQAIEDLPHDFQSDDENSNLYNHYGTQCKVKISSRVGNRATVWEKHSPTIMGRGSGTGGPLIIPHPNQHRRMSIREVARIQTFPDNFVFKGSNSACYRQIGNAVPVLMAYNIAKIFSIQLPKLVEQKKDNVGDQLEFAL